MFFLFPTASWAHRLYTMEFPGTADGPIENGSFEGIHYPPWLRFLCNVYLFDQMISATNGAIKSSGRAFLSI